LRAVGVGFEDRQDLLGHKSSRITTHYSAAEINKLVEAANKVCVDKNSNPTLTLLRKNPRANLVAQNASERVGQGKNPHKIPTIKGEGNGKKVAAL